MPKDKSILKASKPAPAEVMRGEDVRVEVLKAKHPGGRPSKYCKDICDEICTRLSKGESLRSITRDDHMPWMSTIIDWLVDNRKVEFHAQYARAREVQAENMFEEMVEISDDGSNDWMEIENAKGHLIEVPDHEHINRSRLRVDVRKWYLSKVLPKKFGEKQMVEHSGSIDLNAKSMLETVNAAEARSKAVVPSKN